MWQDPDGEESFLDIMVATKQDCRELVARLKDVTSFSEIIISEYVVPFLSFAVSQILINYSILDPAWRSSVKKQLGSSKRLRMRSVSAWPIFLRMCGWIDDVVQDVEFWHLGVISRTKCWASGPCLENPADPYRNSPYGTHVPHLMQRCRSHWRCESAKIK